MTDWKNQIVVALGRKRSGKSQLMHDMFSSRASRVITLGMLPEDMARDSNVIPAVGLPALADALMRASAKDAKTGRPLFPRWHIATALEPDDVAWLYSRLAPPLGSPKPSLSMAFNGIAIECGEAYDVFPNGRTREEILAGLRRGRHYKLDHYLASQRAASCAREVTAQADLLFLFAQSEPRDIEFIRQTVSDAIAEEVRRLRVEDYECICFNRDDGTVRKLTRTRETAGRPLDLMAAGR